MNTQYTSVSPKVAFEAKYKNSRLNLLLMIALTLVNIVLLFADANSMLLFSATIPYVAAITAIYNVKTAIVVTGIIVAAVLILLYLLCWLMSKKHYIWMVLATVLFTIDTIYMIYFYYASGTMADGILDIAIHAFVFYYLITGIINGRKLLNCKNEVIEGEATIEYEIQEETETSEITDNN